MVGTTVSEAVRFRPLAMVVRFHLLSNLEDWQSGLMQGIANPPIHFRCIRWFKSNILRCVVSLMVRQEIVVLHMRVRFPHDTPPL